MQRCRSRDPPSVASRPVSELARIGAAVAANKASALVPFSALQTLGAFCKDQALRTACGRIVVTMMRDSQLLVTANLAVPFAARARLPRETILRYQRHIDAGHWVFREWIAPDFDDNDVQATDLDQAKLLETGERITVQRALDEYDIDEDEATKRYAESLSPEQLAFHDRWERPQ